LLNKWPLERYIGVRNLRALGKGELTLLRRLVIEPSMRQVELAKALDVTRSAVNQIWKKLEQDCGLRIRSIFDYGKLGLRFVFGWAKDQESSTNLPKFKRWLSSNLLTNFLGESVLSSMMDKRLYFEALLPMDRRGSNYLDQLARFQKRPYDLSIAFGSAENVSNHMNLGLFDGRGWEVIDGFRFGAIIDSARGYADILPDIQLSSQTDPITGTTENLIVASSIEEDYHVTSMDLESRYHKLNLSSPSERTLRRRIASMRRSHAIPYVSIQNIGLTQRIIVTLDERRGVSSLSRLLQAQATTLPQARVMSSESLTAMILDFPESASWFAISKALSELASDTTEMCTFIAEHTPIWKGLSSLIPSSQPRKSK
jgi:predicted transcriptional regulator